MLFDGLYVADALGAFLKLAGFAAMATAIFYSQEYLEQRGMRGGEYYVLCLTALLGVFVLISANNLLTVYLGIELLSLSLYAMVAFDRDSGIAAEAAIKYFVLGAIASGVLLYGMSMLYGMTGTLDLDALSAIVRHGADAGLIIGVAFVVVAVAFKFGAVPFHMWVPDVYQGAPTSVTLYIATVSNLGSFALIVRLLAHGLAGLPAIWTQMLTAMAVLSLLIGNLIAIAQTNLKRMLAYSAIANAGFVLLGFVTGSPRGYQAALNFTIAYVLTTLASFGMILMLARARLRARRDRRFQGARNARSAAGAADAGADVLDRRRAAVRRLLGQAVDHPGAARQRTRLARHLRGADLGGRRLLLSARGLVHVFRGRRRPAAASAQAAHALDPAAQYRWPWLALGLLPNALLAICQRLFP